MIPVTSFKGKSVAVFGLGGSGLASCRALKAGGAEVIACDDSAESMAEAAREGFLTADLRKVSWSNFSALVLAPGVPLTHPVPHWTVLAAREAGVEVIGDIELFCRERRLTAPHAPFVAITGTNGKSTTTALIAHLMKAAVHDVQLGGNIGTAILSLEPPRSGRVHVIEMSSFQIDLTPSLNPTVGILLNVTEDHLDRHGDLAHYAAVKERLVAGVEAGGTAVIGVDDVWCQAAADRVEQAGHRVVRISVKRPLADGLYYDHEQIIRAQGGARSVLAKLGGIGSLRGAHNGQNAAAAAATAVALGMDENALQAALRSFPGLAHRMEQVGRKGNVLFVNDSKATNADATQHALAAFADIYWIAGGVSKSGGITTLTEYFPRIRKAYLVGKAANEFAQTLGDAAPYEMSGTLEVAVRDAARDAAASGLAEPVVLLSPACASYDQYRNFEIRGDHFRDLVLGLGSVEPVQASSNGAST
jgi:UDP-N-acetylmuramoylalanine--D-glutamate ligase